MTFDTEIKNLGALDIWWAVGVGSIPRQKDQWICNGPEARMCLVGLKTTREASVANRRGGQRPSGFGVREGAGG